MTGNEGLGPPFQFFVAAGFTVSVADFVLADVAVIVTVVAFETAPVLIVKLTVLFPAGISTVGGTVATFV